MGLKALLRTHGRALPALAYDERHTMKRPTGNLSPGGTAFLTPRAVETEPLQWPGDGGCRPCSGSLHHRQRTSRAVVVDWLVTKGLKVLMIEEGFRPFPDLGQRRARRDVQQALVRDGKGGWTDEGWPWSTADLGGGTVVYGGVSWRYRPFDFDPSELIDAGDLNLRWAERTQSRGKDGRENHKRYAIRCAA